MTPGQVLATRAVTGSPICNHRHCFSGHLELRHDPAQPALHFSLWWQPAARLYQRHRRPLQLSARPSRVEALLDLDWATAALQQRGRNLEGKP